MLLLLLALCGWCSAAAQDLIVKTDDTTVKAKVLEISPSEVRYKRFANPDGPTYVLPVTMIRYIEYPDGEREYYTEAGRPAAPKPTAPAAEPEHPAAEPAAPAAEPGQPEAIAPAVVPAEPAAPVAEAGQPVSGMAETAAPERPAAVVPAGYELRRFMVGDYFDDGAVRGVVCAVDESGLHGLLVSLDEIYLPWSVFRKPDTRFVGATDRMNGEANMEVVERYVADNGLSWDDFPAFKWCREQGEGWYLPSIDEVLKIGNNYNGGTRVKNDRQARNKFNDALKVNGGKRMDRLVYYFSSTEQDDGAALTSHMTLEPPFIEAISKHNKFLVRAVHRF